MSKKTVKAVALLACLGISLPAMATTILSWDQANNISGSPSGDLYLQWGSVTTNGNIVNYISSGDAMSSSINANYAGQSFGAVSQIYNSNGPDDHTGSGEWIESASSNPGVGSLWLGTQGAASDSIAVASLVSFDEAAWDASGGASDTISSMSLDYQYAGITNTMRMAVKSGGTWYISSANIAASGNNIAATLSVDDTTTWAALTVATSGSGSLMTGDSLSYVTTTASLNDLESVGFFYEGSHVDTARARYRASTFTVETIPEPTTLGLLGITGAALLVIRRRRQK